jgi:hypothetical protein
MLPLLLWLLLPVPLVPHGAVDPAVTQANIRSTICTPGYTARVRPSSAWARTHKRRLMQQAGLPWETRWQYELDHQIPLATGGCPTCAANLTLQRWDGPDGAKAKDVVEARMHRAVCQGRLLLAVAQQCFREGWQTCPR